MKTSTIIAVLVAAACLAIDLAVVGGLQARRDEWPGAGGILGFGLALAQIGLLAMWLVWGRAQVLLRFVVTLLGVLGLSALAGFSTELGTNSISRWFGVLLLYEGLIVVPLAAFRWQHYQLQIVAAELRCRHTPRLTEHQFSIGGLFGLTTAAGILLAVTRFVAFPLGQWVQVLLFFALFAGAEVVLLLLSFLVRHMALMVAVALVLCPICGVLACLAELAPGNDPLALILTAFVQGTVTIAAAACLRAGGLRLVRRSAADELTTSGLSDVAASSTTRQTGEL